jgi:hypothetical protein
MDMMVWDQVQYVEDNIERFVREFREHLRFKVANQLILFEYGVVWLKMEIRGNLHDHNINNYIFNKLVCQLGHMILISHTYEDSFEFWPHNHT